MQPQGLGFVESQKERHHHHLQRLGKVKRSPHPAIAAADIEVFSIRGHIHAMQTEATHVSLEVRVS